MKTKDEMEDQRTDQQKLWDSITWTIYSTDNQGNSALVIERKDREFDATYRFADSSKEMAEEAKKRVLNGESSPVEYYMIKLLMDPAMLAKAMGIATWRVKRHLKPHVFEKLDPKIVKEYAKLFKVDVADLLSFKEGA